MNLDAQLATIRRGTTEVIGEEDILRRIKEGKTLRVKLGVDPTAKDVTLGWAVVLRKLRDFQKMGHIACLIIGDFTAQIGDPSGKSKTRKQLTREEVQANVDAVSSQIYKILDPEKTEIYYNKDWLGKMTFEDVIRLCSRYTVARIMERDDKVKAAYQKAVEMRAEVLAEAILDLSDEEVPAHLEGSAANAWVQRQRMRVDARKWTASKLKPRTYGDNLQVQVTDERISVIDALQAAQARLLKHDDVTDVEAL